MKMHKLILASVAVLTIAVGGVGPANAQLAVIDVKAIIQAKAQVDYLTRQLTQMQDTYKALTHLPADKLQEIATQLNIEQYRNPLGSSGSNVANLANGGGLLNGAQRNGIYNGGGTDPAASEINRSGNSIANTQAMAAQLYQSAALHIQSLQSLEGRLAAAETPKDVADIQARISMEQASFQGQQIQAQSLAMLASADERNQYQRQDETRRQQLDTQLGQIKAHIQQNGN